MRGKHFPSVSQMSALPTFNSEREALHLPAPTGSSFIEYPNLAEPRFKLRVHPPDKSGNVLRQYAYRVTMPVPDGKGGLVDKKERKAFARVGEMDYKSARSYAMSLIDKADELRRSPQAQADAVKLSKRATVADAWKFVTLGEANKREATRAKEESQFNTYLAPLSERYLDELDKAFWDKFCTDLLTGKHFTVDKSGNKKQVKPLRMATVHSLMTLAASLYVQAHLNERIPGKQPTWVPPRLTKKHVLRNPEPRVGHIPLNAVARVWRAADTLCAAWARDQLRIYVLTGLRRSLLSELTFKEVNFEKKRLEISPHKPGTKRRAAKLTESTAALRIPVCDTVLDIIKARLEFATDKKGPVWYTVTDPSRSSRDKTPRHADPRTNWAHIHTNVLSGERFTPHDCRRTFATISLVAKAELLGTSLLLLHSPTTAAKMIGLSPVTMDYINTGKAQAQMRRSAEAVEAYVLGLLDGSIEPPDDDPDLPEELEDAVGSED